MIVQSESRHRPNGQKVRHAVVGGGWISQESFMPGVEQTGNPVMIALVTGDPTKAKALAKRYGIRQVCESGKPKPVMPRSERKSRPCREQIIRLPAAKSEELVSTAAPGGS